MSYNQPKLSACTYWNPNGITFPNDTKVKFVSYSIFVDRNNTIYLADYSIGRVYEWREGSAAVARTTFDDLVQPRSLFVTIDGAIYVDNGAKGKVEKWALNATKSMVVMNVSSACYGLFVDTANNLYCSLGLENRVVKQSLDDGTNIVKTVAGNGSCGTAFSMICEPRRLFVSINFDLYVADCFNQRIRLFKFGEIIGITVVGDVESLSIRLSCPAAIFVDADGHLFIVEQGNHRIIGSNSNGFYCLAGCSGLKGGTSDQLNLPFTAAFDSYGNIFVADPYNYRIQKFNLMINTNGK
jgi:hypothetical protein